MIYVYAVIAAALVPILDRFFPVLRESYSIWLVLVIFVGGFLALVLLHIGIAALCFSFVNLNKPPKAYGFYRFLAKKTIPLICDFLRIKITVTGEELIPKDERFVLVCNHTHLFDPLMFLGAFPDAELTFVGKKEIADKMPIVAKFIWSLKGLFVDREDRRSGAKVAIESIKLLKNDEVNIGIFPEGTRSKDGTLGEFKEGSVKIAAKAEVPITAATLNGVTEIFKRFPFRITEVHIDILKTFTKEEIKNSTDADITAQIRAAMEENLKKYK